MKRKNTNLTSQNKNIIRIALVTVLILLIPFLAMKFTSNMDWDVTDFIVAGALIFGTGLIYELATRKERNLVYKTIIGFVLIAALLLIWIELSVGLFTTWGS